MVHQKITPTPLQHTLLRAKPIAALSACKLASLAVALSTSMYFALWAAYGCAKRLSCRFVLQPIATTHMDVGSAGAVGNRRRPAMGFSPERREPSSQTRHDSRSL